MSPAEFRVTREALGLSTEGLARLLDVRRRAIERWESGTIPIRGGVESDVRGIVRRTNRVVDVEADRAQAVIDAGYDYTLTTFRNDVEYSEYAATLGGPIYTAGWHRAMAGRVRDRVPQIMIEFTE
jgi:transcriptional regulator with XRE-family HTH domain